MSSKGEPPLVPIHSHQLLSGSKGHHFSLFCPRGPPSVPPADRYKVSRSGMGGRPTKKSMEHSDAVNKRSAAALSAFLVPSNRNETLRPSFLPCPPVCMRHYTLLLCLIVNTRIPYTRTRTRTRTRARARTRTHTHLTFVALALALTLALAHAPLHAARSTHTHDMPHAHTHVRARARTHVDAHSHARASAHAPRTYRFLHPHVDAYAPELNCRV